MIACLRTEISSGTIKATSVVTSDHKEYSSKFSIAGAIMLHYFYNSKLCSFG
jgi:hypothetical protein